MGTCCRSTDAYGGSSENRARFLLDVVGAVSGLWGSDRVGIKLSPYWSRGTAYTADDATLADYDQLVSRLEDHDLAYLHLVGPEAVAAPEDRLAAFTRFRAGYHGRIVANLGFDQATGNDVLERGLADAVSFGAPFIANPDLVERFAHGHPLAAGNPDTYYTGDADGYTNYPTAIGAA